MSRTVRMVGLNQYIKAVQKKPAQVEQAVDREIKLSSLRIEKKSKQQSPFDTGWLSNNIYANVVRSMVSEVSFGSIRNNMALKLLNCRDYILFYFTRKPFINSCNFSTQPL